jgi:hypothetical protein
MQLTASNILKAIHGLPKGVWYEYINQSTSTKVRVVDVVLPEGPITIERYDPKKSGSDTAKKKTVSTQMIWRLCLALQTKIPVNFDRILGASYNSRSAIEALIAHTPEFFWCKPGRIELSSSTQKIEKGHKHLIWRPENPHKNGILKEFTEASEFVVSEIPLNTALYEGLSLPEISLQHNIDIDVKRRHLQMQIALVFIGYQLGFRTWIARNDQGFSYGARKIGELDGVTITLDNEKLLTPWPNAVNAALHIDCIWFRNSRYMPAVIEVEHSTGVTSGLTRMKNLKDQLPDFPTRWVIVAADEDRSKVMKEANKIQFRDLKTWFFPYSSVEELYALCQKRKITKESINETFLECFMEPCLTENLLQ